MKTVSEKRKTDSFYREDSAIEYNMHSGYFQDLVGFMGFENALCAMYEEPEEVEALMNYICD
ncbi:MAG: veratrol--corrinoid protein metyltransferase, partial [Lachnospiraceae bacterium]|nr:veratrol--corrinoid protein metyltransferase [Lachnospiraceae bacterium]